MILMTALQNLCPGSEFIIRGDTVEWLDETTPYPPQKEIDAEIKRIREETQNKKQAQIAARQSALNKLMALGLTEEEALALGVK